MVIVWSLYGEHISHIMFFCEAIISMDTMFLYWITCFSYETSDGALTINSYIRFEVDDIFINASVD